MDGLPRENLSSTIRRVVAGFVDGAPAHDLFSGGFGTREGRSLDEWIAHELAEFQGRRSVFGLDDGFEIAIDHVTETGTVVFSVLGRKGDAICQDAWDMDGEGRIVGNGSMFEVVSKLQFEEGSATRRAMAVRSPRGKVSSIVPIGLAVEDCMLAHGGNADVDGFSTFSMILPDDDLLGFSARFRMADDSGVRATETVWLRGLDSRSGGADLYPLIEKTSVTVPGSSRAWTLNVMFGDGKSECLDHPLPGRYDFGRTVKAAVLTDLMDHDWIVKAI
ncbi:hypothetical protein G6L37_02180 [Agrobacterium rubi]|nr:hypothetical protein [Agrobacterium rubi]NTF24202.1 hypothetical protein [Agrobacterium rubi]